MHIEGQNPLPIGDPEVAIAVSDSDGHYERTPLDFETFQWLPNSGTIDIRSYDANGSSVTITLKVRLLEEIFFGEEAVRAVSS